MHPIAESIREQMKQRRRRRGWPAQTCLSDKYVMSYNLLNDGHLDHNDTSMCLALFVERYPGQARWWNLYFPRFPTWHHNKIVLRHNHRVGWARGAALYRDAPRWP
jgi:hypothetical protein